MLSKQKQLGNKLKKKTLKGCFIQMALVFCALLQKKKLDKNVNITRKEAKFSKKIKKEIKETDEETKIKIKNSGANISIKF